MIRILVVDHHINSREFLTAILEPESDLEVIGTAEDGYTALEKIKNLQPDIVLIDVEMPGIDRFSATKIISRICIETKVLVLSNYDNKYDDVTQSLYIGAKGYLLKNTPPGDIIEAIRFIYYKGSMQMESALLEKMVLTGTSAKANNSTSNFRPSYYRQFFPIHSAANGENINWEKLNLQTSELPRNNLDIPALEKPPIIPEKSEEVIKEIDKRQVMALVALSVSLTTAVYMVRQHLREPLPVLTALEQSSVLADTQFTGNVEPAKIFKIAASVPSVVESIRVKIGDKIQSGQTLLELKNPEAEKAREQALQQKQMGIQQEQVALQEQQKSQQKILEIQHKINSHKQNLSPLREEIAAANLRVTLARSQADKIPLPQRQNSIERSQAVFQRNQKQFERFKMLYNNGAISKEKLEQVQSEMEVAQSDLEVAKAAAVAAQKLDVAQKEQSQLQQKVSVQEEENIINSLEEELNISRLQYQHATERLSLLKHQSEQLAETQVIEDKIAVKATQPGVVVELPLAVGDRIYTGNPLIVMAQINQLKIDVPVHARLINALHIGQKASIKVGVGKVSQIFTGKVISINPLPSKDLTHKVEVKFENLTDSILVGQAAAINFEFK